MADEQKNSLTPEQHQQFLTDVLKACHESFDAWVAKAKLLFPDAGHAEAVKLAHQHVAAIVNAAAPDATASDAVTPLGDPTACMAQYKACIAGGGQNCYQQYLACLRG